MLKTSLKILLSISLFYSSNSISKDIIWDLGAGIAAIDLNLYPGSSDSKQYMFPLPYFTLLAKKLEIDRGIRGFLFKSDTVVLDVSADFGIPVDSDDSGVRVGMPDLDTTLQVGPSLEFLLNKPGRDLFDVRFELPLRTVLATDFKHTSNEGWLMEPRFSVEKRRLYKSGLAMKLTLGLKYATRDFHAYYYDVDPAFSTATRPAYASEKGYGGSFATLSASWRDGNWIWWTLLRYQNLNDAVFEESPLVEEKDYYLVGVGFAWIFAQNL
ncbi:MAG: MipA/OmpV family protein [Gammaproteobacteria bacterium]|nr:MipA/OmpV family protein [Gammaproteobacteria bacterium]MCK5262356.1 MipA/OmpV family protein [Gammaproteobacteria bacterium]